MKIKLPALILFLPCLLAGCAGLDGRHDPAPAADAAADERRILVTFADAGAGRALSGNPLDDYRHPAHGRYGNSAWSEGVAGDLAEDYQWRVVAEWPMEILGAACVVYEIPAGQDVAQALKWIAGDRRVGSAQAMRTFRTFADPDPAPPPSAEGGGVRAAALF